MKLVREEELKLDDKFTEKQLDELVIPATYFDYIVGTSTGG